LSQVATTIPVPIEILPFGWQLTSRRLSVLGDPILRTCDGTAFVTDNGNFVIDLYRADLANPGHIADAIRDIPGIVEHGLFLNMASLAMVAGPEGITKLERRPANA
jgi:ribose 5-phosphate isomerase A